MHGLGRKGNVYTTRVFCPISSLTQVDVQEGGGVDLLFHTNTESGKTSDLQSDPKINISFYNSTGEWASVSGEATIITDRDVVRKYYSPGLKAWLGDLEDGKHDGGPEDPRIGVIKVVTKTATYQIASGTALGRGVEVLKGAITGAAPKVGQLREINEDEIKQCKFLRRIRCFVNDPIRTSVANNDPRIADRASSS